MNCGWLNSFVPINAVAVTTLGILDTVTNTHWASTKIRMLVVR